jgi:L-threonylcarbamoyladenylate synthase
MQLNNNKKLIKILKEDGVAVLATDTIYGIVANAFSKKAVNRIYNIKGRDEDKPFIVLISSLNDLLNFGIKLNSDQVKFLGHVWPGKVSVTLPVISSKFKYLHRGRKTIAFRMVSPKFKNLVNTIKKVGPLVAPSANPQGLKPASNITDARNYFKDKIDIYINSGRKVGKSSTLVEYEDNKFIVLREGAVKIKSSY